MAKAKSQNSLDSWTKEAREALTDEEYARSTAKKRAAARKGQQFSKQPKDVAKKTSKHRS